MDRRYQTIGERIRARRKAAGLTLLQMEALTDINNGNLSRIERGTQNLTEPTLTKIAGALGLTLAQLLEGFGDKITPVHQGSAIQIPPHVFSTYKALSDLPTGATILISRIAVSVQKEEQPKWFLDVEHPLLFNADQIRNLATAPAEMASIVNSGRSMEPRLFDGDSVICSIAETEVPDSGGVFALVYSGELLVRRLFRRPGGGMILKCDNPEFPTVEVPRTEMEHLVIIGRVKYRSGVGDF